MYQKRSYFITSQTLQPSDVRVLSPFKGKFEVACNDCMLNPPVEQITKIPFVLSNGNNI